MNKDEFKNKHDKPQNGLRILSFPKTTLGIGRPGSFDEAISGCQGVFQPHHPWCPAKAAQSGVVSSGFLGMIFDGFMAYHLVMVYLLKMVIFHGYVK